MRKKTELEENLIKGLSDFKIETVKIDYDANPDSNPHVKVIHSFGNEIIKDLSEWDDTVKVNKLLSDPIWKAKASFAYENLLEFNFYIYGQGVPDLRGNFSFIKSEILKALDQKKYVHFQWNNSHLHTIDDWDKTYYSFFTGEYLEKPAVTNYLTIFHDQLLALYFFYSTFLPQFQKISLSFLFRLDYALMELSFDWSLYRAWLQMKRIPNIKRMAKVNFLKISNSIEHMKIVCDIHDKLAKNKDFLRHSKRRKAERILEEADGKLPLSIKQITNLLEEAGKVKKGKIS